MKYVVELQDLEYLIKGLRIANSTYLFCLTLPILLDGAEKSLKKSDAIQTEYLFLLEEVCFNRGLLAIRIMEREKVKERDSS